MTSCWSCRADWSTGEWSIECRTCGGGALERWCELCDGKCGEVWRKAVIDSNERGTALWGGGCALPPDERRKILQAMYPDADLSSMTFEAIRPSPARPPPLSRPRSAAAKPAPDLVAPSVPSGTGKLAGPATRFSELVPAPRVPADADTLRRRGPEDPAVRTLVELHHRIVVGAQTNATKWAGIRQGLAMDRERGGWAKSNARYATRAAEAIAALDPSAYRDSDALRSAALDLADRTCGDPDHDDPDSANEDLRTMIRTS